ncbi:MAG: M28 family peptidase [Candidatus Zixiibacteriota bacterium]
MHKLLLALAIYLVPCLSTAANQYVISTDSIHRHIAILASDSLEGRETGEPGEWKAAQYITRVFGAAGLQPNGDNGTFLQAFEFIKRIDPGPKNRLVLNGQDLKISEEFQPLPQSANGPFSFDQVVDVNYGIVTEDSTYNDYAGKDITGKAVLVRRFAPSAESNPHVDFDKYSSLSDKISSAVNRKAAAILFLTPSDKDDTLPATGATHMAAKDIPIVFIRRAALERLGLNLDSPDIRSVSGETELIRVRDTGYNVLGLVRGRSDTTIVVGAHYDHLGWGGINSRYQGTEKKIHYGADDNGSGSAGLLELSRYFASRKEQLHHSVLFMAFSGEEEGILGSSYFAKHPTINVSRILMMANMDMIGRLRDQESGLAIFGTGTAAEFKSYFDSLKVDSLKLTFREPGTGPSDHTAFYNQGIPVLHFFTGAHEDYHRPEDVVEKIDLNGVATVANLVADVVTHFDGQTASLTFQKTKDPDEGKRRSSFSVTLGIMPDYVAEVKGVKVDGVSPDKPAERAGILKGDVIFRMGSFAIEDIYGYMSALGKFKKGDSTVISLERGTDTLEVTVVFK